jgi:outer membrane protein assembly factor BamB
MLINSIVQRGIDMKRLFLGIKGHVVCLDKYTGEELWRTKLKTDWGQPTIVVYSEHLYAYLAGVLNCVNAEDGEVLWENGLKGLGSGPCIISVEGKNTSLDESRNSESIMAEMLETAVDVAT